ncbi:MAG: hypothetical protein JWP87_4589 [Labilithrix sp.]|nr:hypothetical protein [Labilithrix sp.]
MVTAPVSRPKTSIDILEERNALRERLAELEESVARISAETEQALRNPELSVLTLCRIATIARGVGAPPISETRAKRLR